MSQPLEAPRSLLFVPASRPGTYLESALRSRADMIILDLEDGTPKPARESAREDLRALESALIQSALIRVSSPRERDFAEDMHLVSDLRPWGVVLPKCESREDVDAASRLMGGGDQSSTRIIALVESARGLLQAGQIAAAKEVVGLALGSEDLALDIGWRGRADLPLDMARWTVLLAARACGKWAIDSASVEYSDIVRFGEEAGRTAQFGFDGKLVIHPGQVPVVNSAFELAPAEIREAREMIERYEEGLREGRAAVSVRGRMVDRPVADRARLLLRRRTPETVLGDSGRMETSVRTAHTLANGSGQGDGGHDT